MNMLKEVNLSYSYTKSLLLRVLDVSNDPEASLFLLVLPIQHDQAS